VQNIVEALLTALIFWEGTNQNEYWITIENDAYHWYLEQESKWFTSREVAR
jgi:hypothetical protein